MNVIFVALIAAATFPLLISSEECSANPQETEKLQAPLASFSLSLYHRLVQANNDKNLVVSPMSIALALAMLERGSAGAMQQELKSMLSDPSLNDMFTGYTALAKKLEIHQERANLTISNGLFVKQGHAFKSDFETEVSSCFKGKVKSYDFANNAEGSRIQINQWISEQTAHKINDLLPTGSISPITLAVLVNAIYLKAEWRTMFREEDVKNQSFTNQDGSTTSDVPFMTISRSFLHAKNDKLEMLELGMHGGLSMQIILPVQRNALDQAEEGLTYQSLFNLRNSGSSKRVDVTIPKFEVRMSSTLKEHLIALGIPSVFDRTKADFTRMFDNAGMEVSGVIHEAYVKVDVNGTEAAAATATGLYGATMITDHATFVADHPFIFTIVHDQTKSILFIGKIIKF